MKDIVILGASVAGHTLAASLREQDKEIRITLVSDENFLFYDKRRLFDYIAGDVREKDLFLVPPDFYEKNNITFLRQHSVLHVSTSRRQVSVRFKDERLTIPFDQLAVCTGRRTILPDIDGINKEGVYTVDSLSDARLLRQHLLSEPVCCIGCNPFALRFAALLAAKQKEVKIISADAPAQEGAAYQLIPSEVIELIGEGGVQALKLKEGKIIGTSLPVVFSAQTKANMDFLKDSDIETNGDCIVVDQQQRTNLPGIFASGSVCRRVDQPCGQKSWEEALNESRVLAGVIIAAAATKVEA